MVFIRYTIQFLLLITSIIASTTINGQLDLLPAQNKVFDPSRSSILLVDTTDDDALINYYHFNKKGEFQISDLPNGIYKIIFNSIDFRFKKTNEFKLIVNDETNQIDVFELQPGFDNLSNLIKLPNGLNFTADSINFKIFVDGGEGGWLSSIPLVGLLMQYPLIGGLTIAMVAMSFAPMIIGKIDPTFSERVIAAQQTETQAKKE